MARDGELQVGELSGSSAVPRASGEGGRSAWLAAAALGLLTVVWLRLFWHRVSEPFLFADDFELIRRSATFGTAWANLLWPINEHFAPGTRIITAVLVAVSTPASRPLVLSAAGLVMFAGLFPLIYLLLRREFDAPWLGLLGVIVFGFSVVHHDVLFWYAAAQWDQAVYVLVASLLAMQSFCRRRGRWSFWASVACSFYGPMNFAIGVLVGPLSALYLLLSGRGEEAWWRRGARAAVLVAAPMVCLALLPMRTYSKIVENTSYLGKGFWEGIDLVGGAVHTGRSVLEILVLENLGLPGVYLPDDPERFAIWFVVLAVGAVWAVRRARDRRLMILGLAMILANYAIIFPFRAWVSLEGLRVWGRYHLLPQLGVAMFVCGLVAEFGPAVVRRPWLTWRQVVAAGGLAAVLAILHSSELERSYDTHLWNDGERGKRAEVDRAGGARGGRELRVER